MKSVTQLEVDQKELMKLMRSAKFVRTATVLPLNMEATRWSLTVAFRKDDPILLAQEKAAFDRLVQILKMNPLIDLVEANFILETTSSRNGNITVVLNTLGPLGTL